MQSSELSVEPREIGVIIVDHGSRRAQSNELLLEVVAMFRRATDYQIVEPAHMELAEPSIQTAFDRCVDQGARLVVVHPYFLLPGRHWDQDIPRLAAAAAERHEGISFLVTAPLGLHPRMADVMQQRIEDCLAHATGAGEACPLCTGTDKCQVQTS
jgi:sirohydrochlorin ferrochelatase